MWSWQCSTQLSRSCSDTHAASRPLHCTGLPRWLSGKRVHLPMQAEKQETQFLSLDWKNPLEGEMTTHCSILAWLGKSHRQKSLAGCSPWGCKELDVTEHTTHILHWTCQNARDELEVDMDCFPTEMLPRPFLTVCYSLFVACFIGE